MDIKLMCCDSTTCRAEIQAELDRLSAMLEPVWVPANQVKFRGYYLIDTGGELYTLGWKVDGDDVIQILSYVDDEVSTLSLKSCDPEWRFALVNVDRSLGECLAVMSKLVAINHTYGGSLGEDGQFYYKVPERLFEYASDVLNHADIKPTTDEVARLTVLVQDLTNEVNGYRDAGWITWDQTTPGYYWVDTGDNVYLGEHINGRWRSEQFAEHLTPVNFPHWRFYRVIEPAAGV